VNDPSIRNVREKVSPTGDASITEDQSHIEVDLTDGRTITRFVEQSLGNLRRPLSDRQLEEKFRDQALPRLSGAQVDRLIDLCWRFDQLADVNDVIRATTP
jgi:2-methylcitrate dehydratase PrpD